MIRNAYFSLLFFVITGALFNFASGVRAFAQSAKPRLLKHESPQVQRRWRRADESPAKLSSEKRDSVIATPAFQLEIGKPQIIGTREASYIDPEVDQGSAQMFWSDLTDNSVWVCQLDPETGV